MAPLFQEGELFDTLRREEQRAIKLVEQVSEDRVLSETVDSLVDRLTAQAGREGLRVRADEIVDGGVEDTEINVAGNRMYGSWDGGPAVIKATRVWAAFPWEGDRDLFTLRPSEYYMTILEGDVRDNVVVVEAAFPGEDVDPERAKANLLDKAAKIATMAARASRDVEGFNLRVGATYEERSRRGGHGCSNSVTSVVPSGFRWAVRRGHRDEYRSSGN